MFGLLTGQSCQLSRASQKTHIYDISSESMQICNTASITIDPPGFRDLALSPTAAVEQIYLEKTRGCDDCYISYCCVQMLMIIKVHFP